MTSLPSLVPIGLFSLAALAALIGSRQGGGLRAVLIASYCGVLVTSFTGGTSGGVWLVQIALLALAPSLLARPASEPGSSRPVTLLTYAMFGVYLFGILVGLTRFDPSLESLKAGHFDEFLGIPVRVLIAGYRFCVIATLALAFALPLRYAVDRTLLRSCLKICWVLTVLLAVAGISDYLNLADFAFSYRREAGYRHVAVLGFHRGAVGMMLVMGIFLSFAMTQMAEQGRQNVLAYVTAPILFIALLFTWSRGATLAMAAGSMSLVLTLGGARMIKGIVVTVVGAITVYAILSRFPDVQERFSFFLTGSLRYDSAGRLDAWSDLISWLFKNPGVLLSGAGFQNFQYYVFLESGAVELEAAHNNYLHVLAETGIGGFTVFLCWLGAIFVWLAGWRQRASDTADRSLAGIVISMMLAMAVSCMTQESLAPAPSMVPLVLHFYVVLGMIVSYFRNVSAQEFTVVEQGTAQPTWMPPHKLAAGAAVR